MTDQKSEAELDSECERTIVAAFSEGRLRPVEMSRIYTFIDHLKSTRREYARRAFEDGQKRLFVVVTEHDSETRTIQTSRPQTFLDWEAEQEKGK